MAFTDLVMQVELEDIQGLAIRGHGHLPFAEFVIVKFGTAERAKSYINELLPQITHGGSKKPEMACQLAVTYAGLKALALPGSLLASFSREYREGMSEPHRSFVLGDVGAHDPSSWEWGREVSDVHALLMLYAPTEDALRVLVASELSRADEWGVKFTHMLPTGMLQGSKEHFGFRDDISRPLVKELIKNEVGADLRTSPLGEFVLGYKNLYDEYSPSPLVADSERGAEVLPVHPDHAGHRDFGKNGTFLVFRQMEQFVHQFWSCFKKNGITESEAILLASKAVGRWPDGSPLTLCPHQPDGALATENKFGYWENDRSGLQCPIGAHIRRTNPRDHLVTETTQKDSSEMVDKHQMLRKGRPYGPPIASDMDLAKIMSAEPDSSPRGLHFICLVTDIRRQFEFVQNNWVNFHKFGGQEDGTDPLIGNHREDDAVITNRFSIPVYPIRKRLEQLPNFVGLKGGGYFFLPGIKALTYISTHGT